MAVPDESDTPVPSGVPSAWRAERPMERLLAVLDAAGIAVTVWAADGMVDYASRAAVQLLGPRRTTARQWQELAAVAADALHADSGRCGVPHGRLRVAERREAGLSCGPTWVTSGVLGGEPPRVALILGPVAVPRARESDLLWRLSRLARDPSIPIGLTDEARHRMRDLPARLARWPRSRRHWSAACRCR